MLSSLDQHLSNFWYGKDNRPNGVKADFIEALDATDEIKIIGVFTPDISVVDKITARGVTGIGIYAKALWMRPTPEATSVPVRSKHDDWRWLNY